ncbi:hypothetical protein AMTR_s00033p00023220 [Amborella trichopoda]|uniref:Uncharacterized protein n=1 Tax=Amborella trichopoda TaxID=13333 RepID=U5CVN4_AMBTC|nr:hypothetical protein AMTR_s00033p00023220 [Amborella trichopoda]
MAVVHAPDFIVLVLSHCRFSCSTMHTALSCRSQHMRHLLCLPLLAIPILSHDQGKIRALLILVTLLSQCRSLGTPPHAIALVAGHHHCHTDWTPPLCGNRGLRSNNWCSALIKYFEPQHTEKLVVAALGEQSVMLTRLEIEPSGRGLGQCLAAWGWGGHKHRWCGWGKRYDGWRVGGVG